ncbi:MAG: phosphotransferase family protein [Acidimicrobiia bacterium]|nr:phosphotransferase family protein [Acidimicrobiia bacterium]
MSSDTAPIRPEERFDEARAAAYLQRHLPELFGDGPLTFDQFPGGAANLTYRVNGPGGEYVLRRAPLGKVARGGHDMEREHRVLSRLWEEFPEAPRAFHYCTDPDVLGKPFFVMERRHGHVIRNQWPESFGDAAVRRSAAANLVGGLARLHQVDTEAVGLGDLGRPNGFVARQVEGWAGRWQAAATRDVPEMAAAERILRENVPAPQSATILHNDYKLDNTMLNDSGELVAVFDWDMSTRGDPLVDLGTLLAYWADPTDPTFLIFGEMAVSPAADYPKSRVVEQYARTTGFNVSQVDYYEGLALFRIAVIIEQIYARYAAGQTSDERFARFEPLAPLLAEAALEVLSA